MPASTARKPKSVGTRQSPDALARALADQSAPDIVDIIEALPAEWDKLVALFTQSGDPDLDREVAMQLQIDDALPTEALKATFRRLLDWHSAQIAHHEHAAFLVGLHVGRGSR